jgi:acyl carrier protein
MADPSELARTLCAALAAASGSADGTITGDTSMLDVSMDSLTVVMALSQVEAAYGFELTPDDLIEALSARRVGDLVTMLRAKIEA